MANFTIVAETGGTYVLTNQDTGQKTTYATQAEAEEAKKHLTEQEGRRSGQRPNPDEDEDRGRNR